MRVQVIEGIPRPGHLKVGVEHENRVADDIHGTRPLHVREDALRIRQDQILPVRHLSGFMVESVDGVDAESTQLLIDPYGVGLRERDSSYVELPKELLRRVLRAVLADAEKRATCRRASEK